LTPKRAATGAGNCPKNISSRSLLFSTCIAAMHACPVKGGGCAGSPTQTPLHARPYAHNAEHKRAGIHGDLVGLNVLCAVFFCVAECRLALVGCILERHPARTP
jgi:hypothetical protein